MNTQYDKALHELVTRRSGGERQDAMLVNSMI